jgi:flagellin-like protein
MKSLRKNKKAVSDVIAVLLMIAIAVAAALIAYAWVMGYLGGTTNKVGKAIQIQSVANTTTSISVYVQNIGDGAVTLNGLYINGANVTAATGFSTLQKGQTAELKTNATPGLELLPPNTLDIKVVCADGTFTEMTQAILPS